MKNRGFSLMELIVVLLIISFSIALVAPSLSRVLRTVELKGAVKRVAGILRYGRSEAIIKGRTVQVFFESDLRAVRMQSREEAETSSIERGIEGDSVSQKRYFLPDAVRIKKLEVPTPETASELPFIEFYPNGGSNGGSILLGGQDRDGFQVTIHFLTGMVKIERAEAF